jgi:hypothetical protein
MRLALTIVGVIAVIAKYWWVALLILIVLWMLIGAKKT